MNRKASWYPVFFFIALVFLNAENTDGYSYAGLDGLIFSNNGIWYYEELDPLGRPATGIRWENGTIVEETAWLYHGEGQQVAKSVTTGKSRIIETEYDRHGNILLVRETEIPDADRDQPEIENNDAETRIIMYTYDEQNRLQQSIRQEGSILVAIRFEYHSDGSLAEKQIFRNGELSLRSVYRDEENWTETVYHDDQPLLTVIFENGQRKRMQYETW